LVKADGSNSRMDGENCIKENFMIRLLAKY